MQTDTIYEYAAYADEYTLFDCLDRLLPGVRGPRPPARRGPGRRGRSRCDLRGARYPRISSRPWPCQFVSSLLLRDLDLALLTYRPAPPGAMLENFFLIFPASARCGELPVAVGIYTGSPRRGGRRGRGPMTAVHLDAQVATPASTLRAPASWYDLIVVRQPDVGRPLVEAIKHLNARQAQLPDAMDRPT